MKERMMAQGSCPHCDRPLPWVVDAFCPECGERLDEPPAKAPTADRNDRRPPAKAPTADRNDRRPPAVDLGPAFEDIGFSRESAGVGLFLSAVMGIASLSCLTSVPGVGWFGPLLFLVVSLLCIGMYGRRLITRSPALTLARDGLIDHMTGSRFRWSEIRSVRVQIETVNGFSRGATMFLRVATDGRESEVSVDVFGLAATPESIAGHVQWAAQRAARG